MNAPVVGFTPGAHGPPVCGGTITPNPFGPQTTKPDCAGSGQSESQQLAAPTRLLFLAFGYRTVAGTILFAVLGANFTMKDALLLVLFTVVFTVGIVAISAIAHRPIDPLVDTTPRLLDCDADFYKDRDVRVKTEGIEPGDSPNELMYRRRSDQPPIVIFRFKKRPPDKLPDRITGTCRGRRGESVIVEDCRP